MPDNTSPAPGAAPPDDRPARGGKRTSTTLPPLVLAATIVGLPTGAVAAAGFFSWIESPPWLTAILSAIAVLSICAGVLQGQDDLKSKVLASRWLSVLAIFVTTTLMLLVGRFVFTTETGKHAAPPPPDSLTVVSLTISTVTLKWSLQQSAGVREFYLYRDGHRVLADNITTYTDERLTSGTEYFYEVSSIGINNVESTRIGVTAKLATLSATLKPPKGLTTTEMGQRAVTLTWQPGDGEPAGMTYVVIRSGTSLPVVSKATYADSGLQPDTSYSYTVLVNDPVRNEQSAESDPLVVRTLAEETVVPGGGTKQPARPPAAPQNLKRDSSDQNTITMSWSASSAGSNSIQGYRIYRNGTAYRTVGPGILSFQDTGLTPGTIYQYLVRAFDTAGRESGSSAVVSMSTAAAPVPPTAPEAFFSISPSSGSATTIFQIRGQTTTPPTGPMWVNIYWNVGGTDKLEVQVPISATGAFESGWSLGNTGDGHDGEIHFSDSSTLTLVPGTYQLKATFCCAKPGFTKTFTLTIG